MIKNIDSLINFTDILNQLPFFSENYECLGGIWLLLTDIVKLQSEHKDIFNLITLICHYLCWCNFYLLGEIS